MNKLVPDEVILGLLKAQPTHGYDLLGQFQSRDQLGRIWNMSASQIYAVLKRLEDADLIKGRQIEVEDAPSRVVYTITEQGESRLSAWMLDTDPPTSIHRIRVLFLSRIYIARLLNEPLDQIKEYQKTACIRQHQKLLKERKKVNTSFERLTLDYVLGQLKSAISWLDRCKFELLVDDPLTNKINKIED